MILAFMQFPPAKESYGGSQRAWYIAEALSQLAPVHFVLLHPTRDNRFDGYDTRRLAALGESVTLIPVPEWDSAAHTMKRKKLGKLADWWRIGTTDAPKLSNKALADIAAQLPISEVDTVVAVRIPMATIAQSLMDRGHLKAVYAVADYDDIMSRSRRAERATLASGGGKVSQLVSQLQLLSLERQEGEIARNWDAISLCSDDDVAVMRKSVKTSSLILKVPNVVERPLLRPEPAGPGRILFVGNLTFKPNVHGLAKFLEEAWPIIKRERPDVRFDVVGMNPAPELAELVRSSGASLHANVPSVEPHYAAAHVVIAPIFFGSGTRVKILEAMAFGRVVVSTKAGAEGLVLQSGTDVVIADEMAEFASSVISLIDDPQRRLDIAAAAREVQQKLYGPLAMHRAVHGMLKRIRYQ